MGDDNLSGLFAANVRAALGLDDKPAELWRLGEYEAEVKAAASDGSTVDVAPTDPRIDPMNGVALLNPFPGCTVVPKAGSVVRIGWVGGDASRVYARPSWKAGGDASKVVVQSDLVVLGAESSAQFVALANKVDGALSSLATKLAAHKHTGVTTGVGISAVWDQTFSPGSVAATKVKAT